MAPRRCAHLGGLLLRDRVSGLQLAQLHCQLELVLRIGGDGKSLLLEALLECGRSIFKLVIGKRQARVKQWLMPRAPGRRRRHIHTCDSRQGRACILDE